MKIRCFHSLLQAAIIVFSTVFAASPASAQLSLDLEVTVGLTKLLCSDSTDLDTCTSPSDDSVVPEPGDTVLIKYEVMNTGAVTLEFHDLGDSQLGVILSDFPFSLTPGATVFLFQTLIAPTTPTEIIAFATWTARDNSAGETLGSDGYSIVVPAPQLTLDVTVGRALDHCRRLACGYDLDRLPFLAEPWSVGFCPAVRRCSRNERDPKQIGYLVG